MSDTIILIEYNPIVNKKSSVTLGFQSYTYETLNEKTTFLCRIVYKPNLTEESTINNANCVSDLSTIGRPQLPRMAITDFFSGGYLYVNNEKMEFGNMSTIPGIIRYLNSFDGITATAITNSNGFSSAINRIQKSSKPSDETSKYNYKLTKLPKLINIDGLDGCGKTTLSKTLKRKLEDLGASVHYVHFPNYESPTGKLIKKYLNGDLLTNDPSTIDSTLIANLYILDRYAYFLKNKDMLKSYDHIICDRSYIATYIYQTLNADDTQKVEIMNMLSREISYLLSISDSYTNILVGTSTFDRNMELLNSRNSKKDIHEDIDYQRRLYGYVRKIESNFRMIYDSDNEYDKIFTWTRINIDEPYIGRIYTPNEIADRLISTYRLHGPTEIVHGINNVYRSLKYL